MKTRLVLQFLSLVLVFSMGAANAGDGENCHHDGMGAKAGGAAKENAIQVGKGADHAKRFPEISQADLVKAVKAKSIFLVDANGNESFASGHIPGAISFAAAGEKFSSMLPKEKDALIVAYCGGPQCNAWCQAADELERLGYTNVRHYKGGIKEWKSSGLEVAKPSTQG